MTCMDEVFGKRRVLLDRELYVPESWFVDPGRLANAGVPEGARFETSRSWPGG